MSCRKSIFVFAFAALGFFWANSALATCVELRHADGSLFDPGKCYLLEAYTGDTDPQDGQPDHKLQRCSCPTSTITYTVNWDHHLRAFLLQTLGFDPSIINQAPPYDAASWHIIPGTATTPIQIKLALTNVDCSAQDTSANPPLLVGAGKCDAELTFTSPVLTNKLGTNSNKLNCQDKDKTKGPWKNVKVEDICNIGQKCSAHPDSTAANPLSVMSYAMFANELTLVDGFVKYRTDLVDPEASVFTNCTKFLVDPTSPPTQTTIPNEVCKISLGGQPGGAKFDPDLAKLILPADLASGLAQAQWGAWEQLWKGECAGPTAAPTADQTIACGVDGDNCLQAFPTNIKSITRNCSQDTHAGIAGATSPFTWASRGGPARFFDNGGGTGDPGDGWANVAPLEDTPGGNCAPHPGETVASLGQGTFSASEQSVTGDLDKVVNLDNPNEAVAQVDVCGTANFDPNTDATNWRGEGNLLPTQAAPLFVTDGGLCDEGAGNTQFPDRRFKFPLWTAQGNGMGDALRQVVLSGGCDDVPAVDHTHCIWKVFGDATEGTVSYRGDVSAEVVGVFKVLGSQ